MEKAYKNTGYLFIALFAFIIWGFFLTYLKYYPGFNRFNWVMHFHGILLFAWFILIIIQPFLIKYKKFRLHRALGNTAYVMVPLIIISIFMVAKEKFHRLAPAVSREQNVGELVLSLASITYFGLLTILALYYKKNTSYHMRFMIASALLLFGPGVGRVFENLGGFSFSQSVTISVLITEVITLLLVFYDIRMGNKYKPYLLTICLLAMFHVVWALRYSEAWQVVGGKFADLFF